MIQYIKNTWLKHKINGARLLENDNKDGDIFFSLSFQKKHPEFSTTKIEMLIKEYKDFMYLAATSSEECTPSKEVDEIWHHHILHTKDYFDHWCKNVIGKVIHHNPEMPNDTKDYTEQFEKTNKKLVEVQKTKKVRRQESHSNSKKETIMHNDIIPTDNSGNDALLNMMLMHSVLDNNVDTPCNDHGHSHSSESSHSSCSSCSGSSSSSSCSSSSCSSSSCGGGGD